MKIKKISFNLATRIIYFAIMIVGIIIFSLASLFLYKNFYQTLTQSGEVLILQGEVAMEDVNIEEFDKALEKLNNKINKEDIEINLSF